MNKINFTNFSDQKLFPRLSNGQSWEFDFDTEFYSKFHNFILNNPGLSAEQYSNKINFYKFTKETITDAFKLFNTYQCTYKRICGPFMYTNGVWYAANKLNQYDKINLIAENKKLKKENKYLREKITDMINENMDF